MLSGGAKRDPSTGHYQLGARTYDPDKASFLTPDSYRNGPSGADLGVGTDPLTANRYTYVNGDPVNLIDPTGHAPIDPTGGMTRGELEEHCRLFLRNQAQSNAEADRVEAACYERFQLMTPETIGQGAKRVGKAVGPAVAGIAFGAACEAGAVAFTGGTLTPVCVAAGGAITGSLTAARDCPKENYTKCFVTVTAIDTGVALVSYGALKTLGAAGRTLAREIGGTGAVLESEAGATIIKVKPKTRVGGGRASSGSSTATADNSAGTVAADSVMLDASTARAIASDTDSAVRSRLLAQIGERNMVMTKTAATEFQDAVSRLAGSVEKTAADDLMSRVTVVADNPSSRAAALPVTRSLGANDIQIFGTADRLGIPIFTSDLKALGAANGRGVVFDAIVHPSFSFAGF